MARHRQIRRPNAPDRDRLPSQVNTKYHSASTMIVSWLVLGTDAILVRRGKTGLTLAPRQKQTKNCRLVLPAHRSQNTDVHFDVMIRSFPKAARSHLICRDGCIKGDKVPDSPWLNQTTILLAESSKRPPWCLHMNLAFVLPTQIFRSINIF